MSSILIDKIRRAREQRVQAGGHTFVVRRPTDLEVMRFQQDRSPEKLLSFVVGWEGVTEGDIVAGGDPHPLPFDSAVLIEWLSDRMDLFGPVTAAIIAGYEEHAKAKDAAVKN